jgi:putative ABC transport system ATP-binding protein
MPGPAVEVLDLVKKYNGREAVLNGVTFSIDSSEFVTVFGKSGCGKTTLLNIIGGLDRPTSGDVRIEGHSTVGMSEDQLARMRLDRIGFVFQDYNLLSDLTVRENIALPLLFSGKKVAKSPDFLMDEFGITEIADETPNRISGGEAQRVAIARAMMNEPKVILADEPTGNLDSENTMNVIDAFKLIVEDFGATILLATHDKDLSRHSSMILLLDSGKAVAGPEKPA